MHKKIYYFVLLALSCCMMFGGFTAKSSAAQDASGNVIGYQVKYVLDSGASWEGTAPQTDYQLGLSEEHTVIENVPVMAGYYFTCWNVYEDSEQNARLTGVWPGDKISEDNPTFESIVKAGKTVLLTPEWQKIWYVITFNGNANDAKLIGKSLSGDNKGNPECYTSYEYADKITVSLDAIRQGYELAGWALTEDGNIFVKNGDTVEMSALFKDNDRVTLYAVWKENKPAGWSQDENGTWHYYNESGEAETGWQKINNKWYYFDASGDMKTGWLKDNGIWYYLNNSGAMVTGWQSVNNEWYYFEANGKMATGWLKSGNTWYYLKSSGAMAKGWLKVNNVWYYFIGSGKMATGWLKSGNTWYYLKSSGAMATGWQKVGETWYYFQSSGAMKTGWLQLNGTWYYLEGSGAMVTGSRIINGKTYNFDNGGKCLNP